MRYILFIILFIVSNILYADDTYTLVRPDNTTITIILATQQVSYQLTRLPGPTQYKNGCNCLMCIGNHLMGAHNISYEYLMSIGYAQWQTLHDNLHNNSTFKGHVGSDAAYIGYAVPVPGGGYYNSGRRGFFRR